MDSLKGRFSGVATVAVATALLTTASAGAVPSLKIVATIPLPGYGGVAVGPGAVWAVSSKAETVSRIDPVAGSAGATTTFASKASEPDIGPAAFVGGKVWVASFANNTVSSLDPATNQVAATVSNLASPIDLLSTADGLWVANHRGGTVSRIDPSIGTVVATIKVGPGGNSGPSGLGAAADGTIWVAVPNIHSIVGINPRTNAVSAKLRIHDPCDPIAVASSPGALWVGLGECGTGDLLRINPKSGKIVARISGDALKGAATGLRFGLGSIWVTATYPSGVARPASLDRINAATNKVVSRTKLSLDPDGASIAFGSNVVWVRADAKIYEISATG